MRLQLQYYDIELQFKKGTEMYIADTLSRCFLKNQSCQNEKEIETINQLLELPISDKKVEEIRRETEND